MNIEKIVRLASSSFSRLERLRCCIFHVLKWSSWYLGSKEKVIPIINLLLSRMEDISAAVCVFVRDVF